MSGPSTKPARDVSWAPHPEDLEGVRAGLEEVARGEALTGADSEAILRWMETGDAAELANVTDARALTWAETGVWPESSG